MTSTHHPGWRPDRLRQRRLAHGLTLEAVGSILREVAERHGLALPAGSFQTVWGHEHGTVYPGPHYRRLYCLLYQVGEPDLGFRPPLPSETVHLPAATDEVCREDDVRRRDFLRSATMLGVAAALVPQPSAGRPVPVVAASAKGEVEVVAAIRRALIGIGQTGMSVFEPSLGTLHDRVQEAWRLRQSARYRALGQALPALLVDARTAAEELTGDHGVEAAGLLVHAYNLTSSVLSKLGDRELAAIAADRAVAQGRGVAVPLLVAAAAYRLANVLLPAGRPRYAQEITLSAAAAVEPAAAGSVTAQAMWGALLLTAAVAAARDGDPARAWELVGEAKTAARRLRTDYADLHTIFGPTTVAMSGVEIAVELGDGREALRRSTGVDITGLPPHLVERRTRFLVDVAWGYGRSHKDATAVAALLEAERLTPEELRYDPTARALVLDLLGRERRGAAPGLRELAGRMGVVA